MAGAKIIHDLRPALNGLDGLAEAAQDMTALMEELARYMEERTTEHFAREEGPGGVAWPQSLRAKVKGGQTLRASGGLIRSITSRWSASEAEVGTNKIHAAIHQFGGVIKPKNAKALAFGLADGGFAKVKSVKMPARPFLGLDAGDETEIQGIVADWAAMAQAQGATA